MFRRALEETAFLVSLLLLVALPLRAEEAPWELLETAGELYGRGEIERALDLWAEVARREAEAPADAAAARNNRCVVLRLRGEIERALEDCRVAVDLRERLEDSIGLPRSLNNLGLALQEQARFEEAEAAFRRALELNRTLDDPASVALNLNNLAALQSTSGAFARALGTLSELDDLLDRFPDAEWTREQEIVAVLNRGVALEGIGAYREALRLSLPWTAPDRLDAGRRGALLVNLGTLYRNLDDAELAVRSLEEGGRLLEQVGDLVGAANADLNRGRTLHLNLGRLEDARALLDRTVGRFVELGARSEELRARVALGQVLLDLGDLESARATLRTAWELARSSESLEGRWTALHALARLDRMNGDVDSAIDRLQDAFAVVESGGAELREAHRWGEYLTDRRAVHELLVDSLLERRDDGDPDRALQAVWAAKDREIFAALRTDPGELAAPSPERLRGVQAALGDSWLIELFVAEGRLHRFVLRNGGVEAEDLGDAAPLEDRADDLVARIALDERIPGPQSAELGAALLGGLGSDLRSDPPPVLRIAADGAFRRLPFGLLGLGEDDLIDLVDIATVPGGPFLTLSEPDPERESLAVLAVADPAWRTAPGARQLATRLELPELPGALLEIEAIERRLRRADVVTLSGAGASEEDLVRSLEPAPDILHLATHTILDDRTPAILLAGSGSEDGLWTPREIVEARLGTSLVVLSSCRSAARADGHGLSSLAGAFLAGGADAVVATLWDVDDRTTSVFMDRFYRELGRGRSPVTALAEVQRAFRRDSRWSGPREWAAFVVIGDGSRPLVRHRGLLSAPVAVALAATALGILLALAARRRAAT